MKELDALCMGELLIDFVASEPGPDVGEAPAFTKNPGGAPANVAVGLSRLGRRAAFAGKVGDDPFGRYLARVLEGNGVDVSGLAFDSRARTALAFVSLGQGGERSFSFYRNPSADMLLHEQDLDSGLLGGCRTFVHGSISLISEPSRSATYSAISRAGSAGALICFDPNLREGLWPGIAHARRAILEAASRSDLIKAGEDELLRITGCDDPGSAVSLLRRHTKPGCAIVVTMGRLGCALYHGGAPLLEPGYGVEPVDTTGAGDGFFAGLISSLLEEAGDGSLADVLPGLDEAGWRGAMRRANAVGAMCTTSKGAIPSLPSSDELRAFMSSHMPG